MTVQTIRTDHPVMTDRSKITREIAAFWNATSEAFRYVWGPHIHHGYFENTAEPPIEAQERLIEKLAALVGIRPGDKILDAGCGMGGSSLYLAKKHRADVTGISLSQKQIDIAAQVAAREDVENVTFKVEDALSMKSFPDNGFDIVWSLESCEQFYDKDLFLKQARRVLKPGGALMLATWCSGDEKYEGPAAKKYQKLCAAFQLPYMPTIGHYAQLLRQNRFAVTDALNWSAKVRDSWKIGLSNIGTRSIWKIIASSGWRGLQFWKDARLMAQGFDEGRVEYGVFVARKASD